MRLYDILQEFGYINREYMNFKLGDCYYDFNSLKPKKVDVDNGIIIFELYKSNNYTNKVSFKALYSEDITIAFLFYTVILEVDNKLYDFPDFVYEPNDKNYFSWILNTVYIQKTEDFITLKKLNKKVEHISDNMCLDLGNVELRIISSDGEAIEIAPTDFCFHIKHEDEKLILCISGFQGCEY